MASIEHQPARSFWLDHIQQWDQLELSQVTYCQQHDLCEQKFSYRKRQSGLNVATLNRAYSYTTKLKGNYDD